MTAALAAAFGVLVAAAVTPLVTRRGSAVLAAAGCALVTAVGAITASGSSTASVGIGSWLGFGSTELVSDRLAGLFFAVTGFTGLAVSLVFLERPPSRLACALHATLLLAVATVIGTDNAFVFLLAWEAITVCLLLVAAAGRRSPRQLLAAYAGGGMSKLGGAALLAAFGLLYAETGSFSLSVWGESAALGGGQRTAAFVLFVIAFGTKLGAIPFQAPLPPLYAAAPGALTTSISIAFNAAFYGLWRLVFDTLGPAELWWGEFLIVLGGVGALVGILYAVGQEEIKRFLGFSSVEHAGIVLIGFGVGLVGQATGKPFLAAAGLLAATLHVLMHGTAKALALLAADRVAGAAGTSKLEPLGGLGGKLPRTAAGFGVAVLTLAAMPPFAGFVSEWFTLEALLQAFRVDNTGARLIMALGAALLALTAGVGLLAFAKLYGGIFLGRPRRPLGPLTEPGPSAGLALLAVAALSLGALAPWEIRWIGEGLEGVLGFDLATSAISHPLVLGPVFRDFSVLAPTWLAIAIPSFALAAWVLARGARTRQLRRAPVWASGSGADVATLQYTPEAYANPIRVVLRGAYGFRRDVGPDPAARPREPRALLLSTRVVPGFELYLYRPLARGALWLAGNARRLQSGKLGYYILYILIVLLAVLALIAALR